jgi:hypothetical protein
LPAWICDRATADHRAYQKHLLSCRGLRHDLQIHRGPLEHRWEHRVHPPRRHLHIRFRRRHPLVHYGLRSLPCADHQDLLAEHLEVLGEHPLAEH